MIPAKKKFKALDLVEANTDIGRFPVTGKHFYVLGEYHENIHERFYIVYTPEFPEESLYASSFQLNKVKLWYKPWTWLKKRKKFIPIPEPEYKFKKGEICIADGQKMKITKVFSGWEMKRKQIPDYQLEEIGKKNSMYIFSESELTKIKRGKK